MCVYKYTHTRTYQHFSNIVKYNDAQICGKDMAKENVCAETALENCDRENCILKNALAFEPPLYFPFARIKII